MRLRRFVLARPLRTASLMKLVLSAYTQRFMGLRKTAGQCTLILPERREAFFGGGALHPGYGLRRSARTNAGRGVQKIQYQSLLESTLQVTKHK